MMSSTPPVKAKWLAASCGGTVDPPPALPTVASKEASPNAACGVRFARLNAAMKIGLKTTKLEKVGLFKNKFMNNFMIYILQKSPPTQPVRSPCKPNKEKSPKPVGEASPNPWFDVCKVFWS